VRLELGQCPDLDETEVRRIATAELRAQPSSSSGPDVLDIAVTCEGPRVIIRVKDPLSRKAVQRSFNLAMSDPPARSRLVAIAATELVLASWAELEVGRPLTVAPEGGFPGAYDKKVASVGVTSVGRPGTRAPAEAGTVEPAGATPVDQTPYEPTERRWYDLEAPSDRMFRVTGVVSTRKFFKMPGLLWGGGFRTGEERFRFMSWSADMLFESGSVCTADNHYDLFTATIGGALLLWARLGPITGRIGVGLRAGLAEVGGNASSVAPWGWPLGTSSFSIRITRHVVLDLSGEAGYVVLPAERNGQPALKGGWFSGQLGLGIVPSPNPPRTARETAAAAAE
jgi:hypothetical protein